jgi:hypothetical protein
MAAAWLSLRDGYYSRAMWTAQSSFAAGTVPTWCNAVVNRRTSCIKTGASHLQTDYLTTQWFGRETPADWR